MFRRKRVLLSQSIALLINPSLEIYVLFLLLQLQYNPVHFTLLSPASAGTRLPPGARFSKVPVVTFRARKAVLWFAVVTGVTGNNFANDKMAMKLSVNKAELTGL